MPVDGNNNATSGRGPVWDAPGARPGLPVDLVEDDEGLQALLAHLNLTYTSPEQQRQQADPYHDLPLYTLPDEPYLEASVLPLLLRGLEELAVARPKDPLAFLGAYLISNNPQRRAVAPSLLQETWTDAEKQAYAAATGTAPSGPSSRPASRKSRSDGGVVGDGSIAASSPAGGLAGAAEVGRGASPLKGSVEEMKETDWFSGTTRRRKVPLMERAYRAAAQFDPEYVAELDRQNGSASGGAEDAKVANQ